MDGLKPASQIERVTQCGTGTACARRATLAEEPAESRLRARLPALLRYSTVYWRVRSVEWAPWTMVARSS